MINQNKLVYYNLKKWFHCFEFFFTLNYNSGQNLDMSSLRKKFNVFILHLKKKPTNKRGF